MRYLVKNELIEETYKSALKALKAEMEREGMTPSRIEVLTKAVEVLSRLPISLI